MSVEVSRGCGYRKVGGLYLCSDGLCRACDRLPYPLDLCPVCGAGIKFSRAWTWLDWFVFAGPHLPCGCPSSCPVCSPPQLVVDVEKSKYGLLWIGEVGYTPESFTKEALVMGVSRRIPAIPRNLELGQTVVLVAHRNACGEDAPGIFHAFIPTRLELLIWDSEATPERIAELGKRGIVPIVIPDGDKDHDPSVKQTSTEAQTTRTFSELRNALKSTA